MQTKKLKTFGLTAIVFALSLFTVQATDDHLWIHPTGGSSIKKVELDNIERITFADGKVSVKTFDGNIVYAFENVSKLTFGDGNTGIDTPLSAAELDAIAYISPAGELIVKSSASINSLTLFAIDGKMVQKSNLSTMFVGSLPASIYILRIDTEEGTVVKKIIKP